MTRYTWRTGLLEALMVIVAIIFVFPVVILVNIALRAQSDRSSPLLPPLQPTLENFARAWSEAHLGGAILNSAIVTVLSVLLIVLFSAAAAYPLARVTRRWSKLSYGLFMAGLLLPFQLAMIPLYAAIRDLGLVGTLWGLVIFYVGVQMPFSIFLYTQFLRSLPRDFEEAALIDGCNPIRSYFSVVFPLLRPVTGTVAILNAIAVWNDFLTPLLYLSGSGNLTIPIALYGFVGDYVQQWNLVFAGLIISSAPVLVVYFLMQRSIIKGFAGGLKG
ncbi:MAG: carbohydrate ABC transporter permease [Protaetiibacter sp.]